MRVLIVEDEKKMASFIERGLTEEGYQVDVAEDGEKGVEKAFRSNYDLIILDVMLPRIDGFAVCAKIREKKMQTPIIMLTARDTVEDKIMGLDHGADDYLSKPFSFDELLARMRALLRRPLDLQKETTLSEGDLMMNLLTRDVVLAGEPIVLSQKEFALLEYLLKNKGNPVSRSDIAEHVWDLDFDPLSNTIDVYINFIRKKIDPKDGPSRIETIRGTGYRFVIG